MERFRGDVAAGDSNAGLRRKWRPDLCAYERDEIQLSTMACKSRHKGYSRCKPLPVRSMLRLLKHHMPFLYMVASHHVFAKAWFVARKRQAQWYSGVKQSKPCILPALVDHYYTSPVHFGLLTLPCRKTRGMVVAPGAVTRSSATSLTEAARACSRTHWAPRGTASWLLPPWCRLVLQCTTLH